MNTKFTDTQKFRAANEIAKKYTRQDPAYGTDHQQTIKTRGVTMVKKTGDIMENTNPKLSKAEKVIISALAVIIIVFIATLIW